MDYIDDFQKKREEEIAKIKKKLKNAYPSKNGLNPAEILMLYYACKYTTDESNFPGFWRYQYGIDDPKKVLRKLYSEGFLCVASALESINSYKASEIKEMLKEQGLKVSGSKQELIERLTDNSDPEYLDKKITKRNYGLTELGKTELQENQYVPYFGTKELQYGLSVWDMNKYLHEHPKANYRDAIWGHLNNELYNSFSELKNLNYRQYCEIKTIMAEFLLEENNRQFEALQLISESLFYQFNVHLFPEFRKRLDSYNFLLSMQKQNKISDIGEMPTMKTCVEQIVSPYTIGKMLKQIKDELNYSNNDLFQELRKSFSRFQCPNPIISIDDLAGLTLSIMLEDNQRVDIVCRDLEKSFYSQTSTKTVQSPVRTQYNVGQSTVRNEQPKRQSFLDRLFGKK